MSRSAPILVAVVVAIAANSSNAQNVEQDVAYDIVALKTDGQETTSIETFYELLPRSLPTRMTSAEITELARRIKNLALFDQVELNPEDHVLRIRVRRKTTISPIFDFSSGKTLSDSKVTLGAVEHDVDGHATRLGGKASYSERGLNFAAWLQQHPYRPGSWAGEYDIYYAGSGFRFEGFDAATKWHRNRFGVEVEFLSPFSFGTRFRYEFQLAAYRELLTGAAGANVPRDGVGLGPTSEFIYDHYTWNDLTPSGFRASLELRPGIFIGPTESRHEIRLKSSAAIKIAEYTGVVLFASASAVNSGNANHSSLLGSQQGVRGLPDSLYRNRAQSFANVELRQAISLGKRWYVQGVAFTDAALFEPMDASGAGTGTVRAWGTGIGLRLLPTSLVDTLLRVDAARLHYPFGSWLVQFGINQYI